MYLGHRLLRRSAYHLLTLYLDRLFVYELHQPYHVIEGQVGEHAVAQIKDMAGTAPCLLQHFTRPALPKLVRAEQGSGIQIALNTKVITDALPSRIKRDPPVYADSSAAVRFDEV